MNISTVDTMLPQEGPMLNSDRSTSNAECSYSLDDNQFSPRARSTLIQLQPCFKVIITEDQVTKDFYANKLQSISKNKRSMQFNINQTSAVPASFENQYSNRSIKEDNKTNKIVEMKQLTTKQSVSTSSVKPSFKKLRKEENLKITPKQSLILHSSFSSPSSYKTKQTSPTRLDFDKVRCITEITTKKPPSSPITRSLFDHTINIFDPNRSNEMDSNNSLPFRCQFYMKPYREEVNPQKNVSKRITRSLSRNYPLQESSKNVVTSDTLSSQCIQKSIRQPNKKRHVSWSPVREYVPQEGPKYIRTIKRKDGPLKKISSYLSSLKQDLHKYSSITDARYTPDQISGSEQLCFARLSTDSYLTPSMNEFFSNVAHPTLEEEEHMKKEKQSIFKSHLPIAVHRHRKEHDEIMEHYDRLLKKMQDTDEHLKSLTRSWVNHRQSKTLIKSDQTSKLLQDKTTNNRINFSPIILQICLIGLIIVNLLIFYFFNEINIWWSEYTGSAVMIQQHTEDTLNF